MEIEHLKVSMPPTLKRVIEQTASAKKQSMSDLACAVLTREFMGRGDEYIAPTKSGGLDTLEEYIIRLIMEERDTRAAKLNMIRGKIKELRAG